MSGGFSGFIQEVRPLVLREPLAEALGAVGEGEEIAYTFTDLVKLAGHACPTMAGAWLAVEEALGRLYGGDLPVRGDIAVTVFGDPEEGTYGVMANAFMLLTGAAPATGFKGLGPRFKRKDLLTFSRDRPTPQAQSFAFRRVDTGKRIAVTFSPRLVPFPPEKARRIGELMEKVAWEAARPEENAEFRELWMEKVRTMLVERKDIGIWLTAEEKSA